MADGENMDPSPLGNTENMESLLFLAPHTILQTVVLCRAARDKPCNINSTMHVPHLRLQLPVRLLQCMHLFQSHRYRQSKNRQGV